MKVTKSASEFEALKRNKEIANTGCYVCPCCETPSNYPSSIRTWCKGLFKPKYMMVDCYRCRKCGAEWESDPYEY